jgi:hypothetical protein
VACCDVAVDCRNTAVDMIVVALQEVEEWMWAQMRLLALDMLTRWRKTVGLALVDFDGMVVG